MAAATAAAEQTWDTLLEKVLKIGLFGGPMSDEITFSLHPYIRADIVYSYRHCGKLSDSKRNYFSRVDPTRLPHK